MKKLLFVLSLVISISSYSQETLRYTVYKTEIYTSIPSSSKWTLAADPNLVDFIISIKNNYMIINAKSPTFFSIYRDTKEDLSTSNYFGKKYKAREHTQNEPCEIYFLNHNNSDYSSIQVAYLNGETQYLLMYYILKSTL